MKHKKYDWKKTARKAAKTLTFYSLPALAAALLEKNPALASVTIGTLATAAADWLKHSHIQHKQKE